MRGTVQLDGGGKCYRWEMMALWMRERFIVFGVKDRSRWGCCCGVFVGLELGGGALGEAKYSCELWVLFL